MEENGLLTWKVHAEVPLNSVRGMYPFWPHVPAGESLSANEHAKPADQGHFCFTVLPRPWDCPAAFYHLSMRFQPEIGIRDNFYPLGILHVKKRIHSLHGFFLIPFPGLLKGRTGNFFLHSFSASFKETALKHFHWGASCVRSSKRDTTQTVSEGMSSANFSCSGDAGDFVFSFTIVSNGSSPSVSWERGTRRLPGEREHVSLMTPVFT